jgi:hypothetical protein
MTRVNIQITQFGIDLTLVQMKDATNTVHTV